MNNNQERTGTTQETLTVNPENIAESQPSTKERIDDSRETAAELSPRDVEARAEKARVEALETAKSTESGDKEKTEKDIVSHRRGPMGKKQLDKSYSQTMKQVQGQLPIGGRMFSKIIHIKAIEKTSDFLSSTIARPNAILSGAFFAFVLSLLTYTVAKTVGYSLSGFETIAAFTIGWTIGIIYDYLRLLFTGKKF